MNNFINKLREIWSIPELRTRILITIGFLAVYRFGSYVILPGIDAEELGRLTNADDGQGLLGLLNAFTGGAFFAAAVFALGIMPYISASIIVQLLGFAVPYFQKLQKDGENGQRKMNQITRVITIAITVIQGSTYLAYLKTQYGSAILMDVPPTIFWLSNVIILTSGTIFCMWLGERITDKGVGNGISLLITAGIIASLPTAFVKEFGIKMESGGPILFLVEMAILVAIVMATVALVQGVRKIKIQFAKHMIGRTKGPQGGQRDYIPIKLNAAGVMPIIFAQALMFIPGAVAQAVADPSGGGGIWAQLADFTSLPYNIVFFILVVVFTFVYTALIINPQQQADFLKRQNAFIPGVKPGNDTAEYIDKVTTLVTLPGSIALGIISILPGIAAATIASNIGFAIFYGGTSLLILVAVVLDTLQQIEGHLLMRRYDGLIKSGKIKGREKSKSPV